MAKTRTPPSIDLTSFADEHLFYEAQMFVAARELLRSARPESFEMNAGIELCVLHFRNLVDFFYLQWPQADDVVAADYVPDWENKRPGASTLLDTARTRANKETAHLTAKRMSGAPPEKAWDFSELSTDLKGAITTFTQHAGPSLSARTVSELQKI